MNTYKCPFIINLICAVMLSALPLGTFALPSVSDETEQPVSQEEIIDNSTKQSDNTENPIKDEIKKVYAPADYYNFLPQTGISDFCYERKNVLNKKPKTHYRLSKYFNKILKKAHLNGNLITHALKNKFNELENLICNCHTITTIDFAPYYFIMPSIPENYLRKTIFPKDITNIRELLPYTLTIQKNTIYKMDAPENIVTSRGVTDMLVLLNAPSPKIEILGKPHFAKLVIDIRNNTLYKYDENGFPLKAYLVATGASGTRTSTGLRIVTYKERFPYAGDPTSKRAQDPYSYGPYIIFMNVVNPKTGRQYVIEQLLHGNGSEYSIGKKVSHGCVRTNNSVMKYELSKEVKRGDYILLINPDIG